VGSQLEALARSRSDVRLRVVDVVSWSSPVAKQHGIRRLPTLWLYRDGERVTTDTREALAALASLAAGR
jgi:hypothetical protein